MYPLLLKVATPGQLLGLCFSAFGVVVLMFSRTHIIWIAQLTVAMMAFPMASLFTLPAGLTVQLSDGSNLGRNLGALNCFAVIPQLIDTVYVRQSKFCEQRNCCRHSLTDESFFFSCHCLQCLHRYTGWVSKHFGEAAVMNVGAVWGILTAISAFLFMTIE